MKCGATGTFPRRSWLLNRRGWKVGEVAFVMNVPVQFQTDEFFRYAAECSRMARLARRQENKIAPGGPAAKWLHWVSLIRESLIPPSPESLRSAALQFGMDSKAWARNGKSWARKGRLQDLARAG